MTRDIIEQYEQEFSSLFQAKRAFAFWKGRVALYAILKAMGIGQRDEVILPGYTCVMNVNPIKYLGAKPVYVDIEPNTFNINPKLLPEKITNRTKVIIAQHTYGYVCDMDAVMEIAGQKQVPVIEDCCLSLGSKYKGQLAGTFGEAAYFSFQWNKPYTTGLGGMAVINAEELAERIETLVEKQACEPGFQEVMMLWVQLCIYRAFVYPRTTALAQSLFRYLTKKGVIVGSSAASEFKPTMADDFLKKTSNMQAGSGLKALKKLDNIIAHRKVMADLYDRLLSEKGWPTRQYDRSVMQPVMVRYPVRIKQKDKALSKAAKAGKELGSWFECPLHPIETPLQTYDYTVGMCPEAEKAAREVVNLPLHSRVSEKTAWQIVDFITAFTASN